MLTPHTIATLLSAVTALGSTNTGSPATQSIATLPNTPAGCVAPAGASTPEVTLSYSPWRRRSEPSTVATRDYGATRVPRARTETSTAATQGIAALPAGPASMGHGAGALVAEQGSTLAYAGPRVHPPIRN
jgi:hypothetical protein